MPTTKTKTTDAPAELRDFRNFLFLTWKHLGLPEPTPVQYDIAHRLQHGPRRDIIEAFRGVGKSWITAAFVCWRLLLNPNEWIMVVSAGQDRATQFSQFVRRLIFEMPLLTHLKPGDGQRFSTMSFDVGPAAVAQSPSVKSVGITGQLTGSRATLIVADDIEIPSNADTVVKREKLAELIKEFDAVLVPGGEVKYLGTPQTEESLYATHLPARGYSVRIWPARVPSDPEKYRGNLAPRVLQAGPPGAPVDPRRFTDEDLLERELSYGRSGFALQFMLDTELSDVERYPLKLRDFVTMPLHPEMAPVKVAWAGDKDHVLPDLPQVGFTGDRWVKPMYVSPSWEPYQGCVLAIDPSGRGKDELGYAVVKMLHGNLFVADCGGMVGGYTQENLEALSRIAKQHKVKQVIVEENFGGGMFSKLLEPVLARVYPCSIEEVRHSRQKELRIIDTLEPVMNQHRLLVDEGLVRRDSTNYNNHPTDRASEYRLFHQLTRVTRERGSLRQDDRLDALSMAVAYWVEAMRKDDQTSEREARERLMALEAQKFIEEFAGRVPERTWSRH